MIAIFGAGLYGLTFAHFLRNKDFLIVEKDHFVGGLCKSLGAGYRIVMDRGGHVFHSLADTEVSWLNSLGVNLVKKDRVARIYLSGKYYDAPKAIDYPFQTFYGQAGEKVAAECGKGLAKEGAATDMSNLSAWLKSRFGPGIMKHFFSPYNKKYWKFPTNRIDVVGSNRVPSSQSRGYNSSFYYPNMGGCGMAVNAITQTLNSKNFLTSAVPKDIDADKKTFTANKITYKWDKIVSSVPIYDLVNSIRNAPAAVRRCAKALKYTSMYVLTFIWKSGKKDFVNTHWVYLPDPSFPFCRAYFMKAFSENTSPEGYEQVSLELPVFMDKKIEWLEDLEHFEDTEIDGIRITMPTIDYLSPAYCIFDKGWQKRVETIQEYLKSKDIYSVGRYGSWQYWDMGETIRGARALAQEFNK